MTGLTAVVTLHVAHGNRLSEYLWLLPVYGSPMRWPEEDLERSLAKHYPHRRELEIVVSPMCPGEWPTPVYRYTRRWSLSATDRLVAKMWVVREL